MALISGWEIDIITDWDEIYSDSFQDQWHSLIDNAINAHVFFHPSLCLPWIDSYRPIRNLTPLFCLANRGSVNIFLPMVLWRQNWKNGFLKVVIPVGHSDFDYHDPLVTHEQSLEQWSSFFNALKYTLKDKISFDELRLDGMRLLVDGKFLKNQKDIAYNCDLSGFKNGEDFLQSLTTSLRSDINRQIRRIEESGPIILHDFKDIKTALENLPSMLKWHSDRWPKAYKADGFYENLIKSCIKSGLLHFTILKTEKSNLSYHLGFLYNNRYYYYLPAIDWRYENFSPGKIHLFKLIEFSIKSNIKIFDHLRGNESYKSGFSNQSQNIYNYSFCPDFISHIRVNLIRTAKRLIA
jgi:CelD/BcsL family acetyltransferase involved in cellulose biosynthesis